MKFSKLTILGLVCVLGVMVSSVSMAQNSEAVNADDILANRGGAVQGTVQTRGTVHTNEATSSAKAEPDARQLEIEKSLAEAMAENKKEDLLAKKIKLAKQMHVIRPTREQVDSAVRRASASLPEKDRQNFISVMKSMLNYNAIERISVDAMVETYTVLELESMVEYYGKPEARSASNKVQSWGKKFQPEVVKMIDRAMMRIKTGQ